MYHSQLEAGGGSANIFSCFQVSVIAQPHNLTGTARSRRANGGALASIHSHEEQTQAAEACSAFANNDEAGTTVAGDTAAYGCARKGRPCLAPLLDA